MRELETWEMDGFGHERQMENQDALDRLLRKLEREGRFSSQIMDEWNL